MDARMERYRVEYVRVQWGRRGHGPIRNLKNTFAE